LRYLEEGKFGDEWYLERLRNGYTQNGTTKMPKFEGIFTQEAMWAIRTYIESRPQD
jgi:mono/diheme cytochrome c family protein